MKYKFVSEDEHTFTIQHPDGSNFSIAKHAVGDEVHKRIKGLEPLKMAEGGIVPDSELGGSTSMPDKTIQDPTANLPQDPNAGLMDQYRDFAKQNNMNASPEDIERHAQDLLLNHKQQEFNAAHAAELRNQQATEMQVQRDSQYNQEAQKFGLPMRDLQAPTERAPAQNVILPEGAVAPAPASPQADMLSNSMAIQGKSLDAEQKINNQFGKQAVSNYQQSIDANKQLQIDLDSAKKQFEPVEKDLQAKGDGLFKAIMDQKIDHNRLFNNMSTGNKVLAAISVMLSGFGAGLQGPGAKNQAMEILQKQIDRDIDAQRAELGKKQTLFSENLRQLGDVRAARAATVSQLLAAAQAKAQMIAAQMGSTEAQQRMALANNEIGLKRSQLNQQSAIYSEMAKGGASTDKMINYLRIYNPAMAKEMEGRHVPGVGMAAIPVSEKVRDQIVAHQQLDSAAKDLQDWTKTHSTVVPGTADYNVGAQKAQVLQQLIRHGQLQTVYREGEQPLLDKMVNSNPAGFLKAFSTEPKLLELMRSNESQLNTLKKGYGLPVSAPSPQIKVSGGKKYMRGPNGEAIEVR